ncbi:hypothetical protein ATANTOWER_024214 [Ataeniobius toweri]|uniref:Uncharacterized protein n=1 Tax=Ataeniobius toweri TaxID=208326 RepID=A0ABU7CIE2_9TELE|nr:hypothetical protein [Ataeniobius toweri]
MVLERRALAGYLGTVKGQKWSGFMTNGYHRSILQMTWFCWLSLAKTYSMHWGGSRSSAKRQESSRISLSKSKAMVLNQKWVACPHQVRGEFLPHSKEYLGVLFRSEVKM